MRLGAADSGWDIAGRRCRKPLAHETDKFSDRDRLRSRLLPRHTPAPSRTNAPNMGLQRNTTQHNNIDDKVYISLYVKIKQNLGQYF